MAKKTSLKTRVIHLLSWVIVIGIFLYVLASIVPPEKAAGVSFLGKAAISLRMLAEAVAGANILGIFILTSVYFCYLLYLDSAGTRWVIQRFNCAIGLKEMVPARAITFLLAVLNYQAGQLGIPLFLKRVHDVPLLEGTGSIVFIGALDLFIVFCMATTGALFIREGMLGNQILLFGFIGISFYILNAFFWRSERFAKPLIRLFGKIPFVGHFLEKERSVFYTFQKATFLDYLKIFFFRLPIHLGILVSLYFLIRCFHESIPFLAILIYFPVIMVISIVPIINVGAVGAAQASVVYFFKDYAPEATLLAVGLVWAFSLNGIKVVVGALFLTRHSTKLFRQTESKDPPLSSLEGSKI